MLLVLLVCPEGPQLWAEQEEETLAHWALLELEVEPAAMECPKGDDHGEKNIPMLGCFIDNVRKVVELRFGIPFPCLVYVLVKIIYIYVCVYVCLSACLSVCLSACLSVCLPIYLSIYLSILLNYLSKCKCT